MRKEEILKHDWKFLQTKRLEAYRKNFDDSHFQTVRIPHDYAITGPFSENCDLQFTAITPDGRPEGEVSTGRTGGLPIGERGVYRKNIFIGADHRSEKIFLEFDGVMFQSTVYVNDIKVACQYYGYTSFQADITDAVVFGEENLISVVTEPHYGFSRWYTGAGIYRNVKLVFKPPFYIDYNGVYISSGSDGSVHIETDVINSRSEEGFWLDSLICDASGNTVSSVSAPLHTSPGQTVLQRSHIPQVHLWNTDDPYMYTLISRIRFNDEITDEVRTAFGVRSLTFERNGFFINGKKLPFKGVCLHHDLGALGAAAEKDAISRQLDIMLEMGCNAIRTSHNPAAPEFLDLCDQKGILVIEEAFDEWRNDSKTDQGYAFRFDKEARRDIEQMLRRDRNHPCIIMWSIGNEIPDQEFKQGAATAKWLTDICHKNDPSRLVTAAFDRPEKAMANGLTDCVDVIGINYHHAFYEDYLKARPNSVFYGSETNSTFSSRGVYYFGTKDEILEETGKTLLITSYDTEYPHWGSTPDQEFEALDRHPEFLGEFVWTGFDYIGEPTPFYAQWPSRSSYFGIVDLAGLPKDRYYSYQSRWTDKPVLHPFPHWTWPGMEGKAIPVHCYTSFPQAELFINGKSYGIRRKNDSGAFAENRLIWENVVYEPGELKVAAMDSAGNHVMERAVYTAKAPAGIILSADRKNLPADGDSLVFVTASIVDGDGNLCPTACSEIKFSVENGQFLASDGGDQTSLIPFQSDTKPAFNGFLVGIFRAAGHPDGRHMEITAESPGIPTAKITVDYSL